jgi:hypothetical protein
MIVRLRYRAAAAAKRDGAALLAARIRIGYRRDCSMLLNTGSGITDSR